MRLLSLLIIASLLSCSEDKLVTVTDCGKPCYTGNSKTDQVGVCSRGTWSCNEDGEVVACAGQTLPSAETCDGQDNDCDGKVDDSIAAVTCSTACGTGLQNCVMGQWSACPARLPSPEVCDNRDNDCDGETDEQTDLPVNFCYTGPAGTVGVGACMPGITRCSNGIEYCWQQTLPSSETCDGEDNNCNGETDEGIPTSTYPVDLIFLVDNSCSMVPVIDSVKLATSNWTQKYGNRPEIQFALVGAPGPDVNNISPLLIQNFTNPATFKQALSLQTGYSGYGLEPTLDALEMLADSTNPLSLSYRAQARKIAVVFSDEPPQNYFYNTNTTITASNLRKKAITTHVFTASSHFPHWNPISGATGGMLVDIALSASLIESNLDLIIQKASCQP